MTIEEIKELRKLLPCEMEVWDLEGEQPKSRTVTEIFNSGSCRAVSDGYENRFRSGDEYNSVKYYYCRPIQQKTKRLANRKEWLKWAAEVTYKLGAGISDDVWVVVALPTNSEPKQSNPARSVTAVEFGSFPELYWRAKLGVGGIPIEQEQF